MELKLICKALASVDQPSRTKAVADLQAWLPDQVLDSLSLLKLWKALFYCVWLADGSDYQDQLADSLTKLVTKAQDPWKWLHSFFETMRTEWDLGGTYRYDKYMWLVRLYTKAALAFNDTAHWNELIQEFLAKAHTKGMGMAFHVIDVVSDELSGHPMEIATPFLAVMKATKLKHVAERIAVRLLEPLVQRDTMQDWLLTNAKSEDTMLDWTRQKLYSLYSQVSGVPGPLEEVEVQLPVKRFKRYAKKPAQKRQKKH
jgi:hypothetical protein